MLIQANMYTDVEGVEKEPVMYNKLLPVRKSIEDLLSRQAGFNYNYISVYGVHITFCLIFMLSTV